MVTNDFKRVKNTFSKCKERCKAPSKVSGKTLRSSSKRSAINTYLKEVYSVEQVGGDEDAKAEPEPDQSTKPRGQRLGSMGCKLLKRFKKKTFLILELYSTVINFLHAFCKEKSHSREGSCHRGTLN